MFFVFQSKQKTRARIPLAEKKPNEAAKPVKSLFDTPEIESDGDVSDDESAGSDKENQSPPRPTPTESIKEDEYSDSDDVEPRITSDQIKCFICGAIVLIKSLPRHQKSKGCMTAKAKMGVKGV